MRDQFILLHDKKKTRLNLDFIESYDADDGVLTIRTKSGKEHCVKPKDDRQHISTYLVALDNLLDIKDEFNKG